MIPSRPIKLYEMRFVQETFKLGKWKLLTQRVKRRKEKKKMVSISHNAFESSNTNTGDPHGWKSQHSSVNYVSLCRATRKQEKRCLKAQRHKA